MLVEWSEFALDQADRAVGYINQFSPKAASELYARFEGVSLLLSDQPLSGRPGRVEGTREYVAHPNYIIVYEVLADRAIILNVVHSRREYP